MLTHWRTTLGGIIMSLGVPLVASSDHTAHVAGIICMFIGPLILGTQAADHASTSVSTVANKVVLLFALIGTTTIICTACSSPVTAAYKAEKAANISVDVAMQAWGLYVRDQKPTVATELKVQAAFVKCQNVELAAVDATRIANNYSGTNAIANGMVTTSYAQYSQVLSDLVTLLRSLGVKI